MGFAAALLLAASLAGAAPVRVTGSEVVVATDANPEFAATARPASGHPVYYHLVANRERAIGRPYAGEKMPSREKVEAEVERALASQGFVRTRIGGPKPGLMLLVIYGTANAALDEIRGEEGGTVIYNELELRQLVGAAKLNSAAAGDTAREDRATQAMQEDRLYVMIGAFDADALARKQRKLVWRARMSIDALQGDLRTALPAMLEAAAPYFGRSSDGAVFVQDTKERTPTVRIGPLEVIDETAPTANNK